MEWTRTVLEIVAYVSLIVFQIVLICHMFVTNKRMKFLEVFVGFLLDCETKQTKRLDNIEKQLKNRVDKYYN